MTMRARLLGLAAISALLMALMTLVGNGGPAVAQNATPTTAATPVPSAAAGIVTLVGWYSRDKSGDFVIVGPIQINENLVAKAGEPTDNTIAGKIDFDDPGNDD